MHFSTQAIMAVAPLLATSASAAPAPGVSPNTQGGLSARSLIVDMDHEGKLDWTDVEGGGQFTHISGEQTHEWETSHPARSLTKRGPRFPEVVGQVVDGFCEGKGKGIDKEIVEEYGAVACTALLDVIPAGKAIDTAEKAYEGYDFYRRIVKNTDDGKSKGLAWVGVGVKKLFTHDTEPFSKKICNEAVDAITQACGDDDTKGGAIQRNGLEIQVAVDGAADDAEVGEESVDTDKFDNSDELDKEVKAAEDELPDGDD